MFATTINSIFTEKISLMEGEIAPSFELFDQDEKLLLSKNFWEEARRLLLSIR